MRDEVGFEHKQKQSKQSNCWREHLTRDGKNEEGRQDREQSGSHSGPEQDGIGIVGIKELTASQEA